MLMLAAGLAAVLIWAGFLYASYRRIGRGDEAGRESEISFELHAAPWSDRHVETLLARHPGSPTLLNQYVANAAGRNDLSEALRRADLFAARAPRSPQAWLTRIDLLRRAGREEESTVLLRKALRKLPRNPDILLAWAHEAAQRGDWAAAARRCTPVRRRAPDRIEGYELAATALAEQGQPAAADAMLAQGMQRLPQAWHLWQAAARLAERSGDRAEALRRWETLRAQFPAEPAGFLHLAEALTLAGRGDEAAALLRQARDFFPASKEVAAAAEGA